MKWSVIASVALASLIKANPIDGDGFDLIERAASKAQFATVISHRKAVPTPC